MLCVWITVGVRSDVPLPLHMHTAVFAESVIFLGRQPLSAPLVRLPPKRAMQHPGQTSICVQSCSQMHLAVWEEMYHRQTDIQNDRQTVKQRT